MCLFFADIVYMQPQLLIELIKSSVNNGIGLHSSGGAFFYDTRVHDYTYMYTYSVIIILLF